MRRSNLRITAAFACAFACMSHAFAQTAPAPAAGAGPVTTITGAKIAPVGGAVPAGSERTLMDLGALDREVEFNKRLDTIAKSKAASGAAAAPQAVAPVQAIVVAPKPEPKKKAAPAAPVLNPGIRLKAVYGIGNNLTGAFALPGDQMITAKRGQAVDGWTITDFAVGGVTLALKKHTTFLRLDAPVASPAPAGAPGMAVFRPAGGNSITSAALPNPNMNAGQFVSPASR